MDRLGNRGQFYPPDKNARRVRCIVIHIVLSHWQLQKSYELSKKPHDNKTHHLKLSLHTGEPKTHLKHTYHCELTALLKFTDEERNHLHR